MYHELEEKYYDFLDWIQQKTPIYEKIVYPIERNGVPSFPIMILAMFFMGTLIGYGIYTTFLHENTIIINVLDKDGHPLNNAKISVFIDSKLLASNYTNENGVLKLNAILGKKNEVIVQKEGFLQAKQGFNFDKKELKIYLNELTTPQKTLPEKELFDYFIATNKTALKNKYGGEYTKKVLELMNELSDLVTDEGIKTRTLFLGEEDLQTTINEHSPKYLLLVGGPRIIPFNEVETPLKTMPGMQFISLNDPIIPSDNAYGVLNSSTYAGCRDCFPDIIVGRLPGGFEEKSDSRLLIELLENTIIAHEQTINTKISTVVSEDAYGPHLHRGVFIDLKNDLWESPPKYSWDYKQGVEGEFNELMDFVSKPPILFLSLHGNGPPHNQLYTSNGETGSYLVLSTSLPLTEEYNAKIVVSDACYGANIYRNESDSIPLHFLNNGAIIFIGATTSALANKRVSRLDLNDEEILNLGSCTALTHRIWLGIKDNERIGDSFLAGKRLMDAFNPADQLTALQFVLYGDPTLTIKNN